MASSGAPIPWHLLPGPLLLIDLETTGLACQRDRIVEVAAVRHAPGEKPRVLNTLVDHGEETVGATAIHGITRRMLDGAPTIDQVLPLLAELSRGATMVAHNASFEERFLGAELARLGGSWGLPRICTLNLARRLHPKQRGPLGRPSHRLGVMAGVYGVVAGEAHTAMGDVRTMSAVLGAMLRAFADDPLMPDHLARASRPSAGEPRWPAGPGRAVLKPRAVAVA